MIRALRSRARQGHRTIAYPAQAAPPLPERFRGRPLLDAARCPGGCSECASACPTGALTAGPEPRVDLGRCLFCTDCVEACPHGALSHERDHRLAARARDGLIVAAGPDPLAGAREADLALALEAKMRRLLSRSLRLRQVSAGGCNACEAEAAVLGTVVYDMGRFGIQFVASPRHADGLLITGPVTRNMSLALRKTWEAVPAPKIVIASGACAISGGPYAGHEEVHGGAASLLPVDLYVPGCPPHPLTLLDGLLRLLGRQDARSHPR